MNRFWFWQRSHFVQYGLLSSAKVMTDPIKHQESIVDETWAILKNSINFHTKMPIKKGSIVNNSYFFNRLWFWQRSHVVEYGLLLNAKVTTNPKKHEESIVDETWAILKNSINFHTKMPIKKGSIVNNSYIFEPILILSTLFRSAVCPLVKCKS